MNFFGNFNILKLYLKRDALIVFLFIFFGNSYSQAFEPRINAFITQQEHTAQEFGDEVLQALYEYRKSVEANAYNDTLQLCEGYRRARNLGPHPAHGKYMFTAAQAAGAWGKILAEGLNQPISGTFGAKADFLEYGNYGMFDLKSWFQSMHTMYLINSLGFLGGAMHCLNTMDQGEIEKFALAIVDIEAAASAITIAGGIIVSIFVPELLFPKIAKAVSFVFRPVVKLIGMLATRIGTKVPLKVVGITVGGVAADNFIQYMNERDQSQTSLNDLINPDSDEFKMAQMRRRFLTLNKTFEIFYPLYKQEETLRSQSTGKCEACEDLYAPYFKNLKETYNEELLNQMQSDLDTLAAKYFPSQSETLYLDMLNAFLPIVKGHFQQQN